LNPTAARIDNKKRQSFDVVERDQIFKHILFRPDFVAMHVKSVCDHEFVMPM